MLIRCLITYYSINFFHIDYSDGNYVSYSYDNACRLTSVTTPFGTTAYEYDLLDRLTRVVDRNGYATVYEYDANGNRTAVHYANGFTTTYEYDLLNRLICEKTVDSEDNVVVQYIYTLGAAGERKFVTELDRTVEYSYDSLYRLTSETITEGEKTTVYTYAYDNVSNRILKTVNGEETVYTYNALNQLVSDSETSYEYDLNGNLIRVIGSAQSALYEYNSENKLIKATVQNGVLVTEETYTYDYSGNRTSKTTHRSDGVTEYVKYLNDNSSLTNVLAEIDENGTAKCVYTIGADLVSQERDGRTSFYLYDGHGSIVGLANESGVVTDTYSYDAFGNLLKSKGNTENCYRYCGEQFDETTGLYYLRARYMDTSTGRFISQDTYQGDINDPVSLHKYLYANNNPVMCSDPSGYVSETDLANYSEKYFSSLSIKDKHDKACLEIGLDIIEELTFEQIESIIQVGLTPYMGPGLAMAFAKGITTALEAAYTLAKGAITKKISKEDIDDIFENNRLDLAQNVKNEISKYGIEADNPFLAKSNHSPAKLNINGKGGVSQLLFETGNTHGVSYIRFSLSNSPVEGVGKVKVVFAKAMEYLGVDKNVDYIFMFK